MHCAVFRSINVSIYLHLLDAYHVENFPIKFFISDLQILQIIIAWCSIYIHAIVCRFHNRDSSGGEIWGVKRLSFFAFLLGVKRPRG